MRFCDKCFHAIEPERKDKCDRCRYANMEIEEILNRQGGGRKAKESDQELDLSHILSLP